MVWSSQSQSGHKYHEETVGLIGMPGRTSSETPYVFGKKIKLCMTREQKGVVSYIASNMYLTPPFPNVTIDARVNQKRGGGDDNYR